MKRILLPILAIALAAACLDPQHSGDVAAQEPSEVPAGPRHNPGKWCTACHGPEGPDGPEISVGGTLYQLDGDGKPTIAAGGAQVCILDATQNDNDPPHCITTYDNGNFYEPKAAYDPVYPLRVRVVSANGGKKGMVTLIGRDAGCGRCHQGKDGDRQHVKRAYVVDP